MLRCTVHVPISLNMNSQMRSDANSVDSETVVTVDAIGGFALFCWCCASPRCVDKAVDSEKVVTVDAIGGFELFC